MKYLCFILLVGLGSSFPAYSIPSNTIKLRQIEILSNLLEQQIKHQINPPNNALEKSISALLKSYPEQIESVLTIAIKKYPPKNISK